jgi:hypothetical protein
VSPRLWVFTTLGCGLIAGGATAAAGPGQSVLASGLSAGLLAATLVAIIWYSWETRRLVDSHESGAELDKHPWLSSTTLKPEEQPEGADPFLCGGFRLWLPIQNVGRTPALDIRVESRWETADHRLSLAALNQSEDQVIVPADTLHAYLGHIGFLVPNGADAELSVRVTYNVPFGGGGELLLRFQYRSRQGWGNGPTRYRFRLASGGEYGSPQ